MKRTAVRASVRIDPPKGQVRFGGACLLLMGLLIGGFCVPALPFASGLAGTRGTLTVESHRVSYSSKGSTTSSEGTFRSDDGKITDHRAEVDPNFALLRRVPVSRAPWASYYVVHPARFLGWLAGSCLAVCFLLLGGPGLVSGRRLSRDAPAPGANRLYRIVAGAFYGAVGCSVLALVVDLVT